MSKNMYRTRKKKKLPKSRNYSAYLWKDSRSFLEAFMLEKNKNPTKAVGVWSHLIFWETEDLFLNWQKHPSAERQIADRVCSGVNLYGGCTTACREIKTKDVTAEREQLVVCTRSTTKSSAPDSLHFAMWNNLIIFFSEGTTDT